MTPEETPLDLTRAVRDISVTERGSFRSCRRRWKIETIDNLAPKQPAWALLFGTAVHSALEEVYRDRFKKGWQSEARREAALVRAQEVIEAWWKDTEKQVKHDLGSLATDEVLDELYEYHNLGREMLANYVQFDEARNEKWDVVAIEGEGVESLKGSRPDGYGEDVDVVRSESGRFMVPIVHPETHLPLLTVDGDVRYLTARLDLIVERPRPHTGVWIVDHKTTSSSPSDRGIDFEDQITGYCYVLWRLTGIIPRGVVFNYLVKKAPKPPRMTQRGLSTAKDQACLPGEYRQALIAGGHMVKGRIPDTKYAECYDALLAKGWDPFFKRLEVRRNEQEILNFERRLYEEALDMAFVAAHPEKQYPNLSAWSCPSCSVNRICQAMEDGSDVDSVIEGGFIDAGDRKALA